MEHWFRASCPALGREVDPSEQGVTPEQARTAHEAALCLARCQTHLLEDHQPWALAPDLFTRCRKLWRQASVSWNEQLSNGSSLPDLLWLVCAHLFSAGQLRTARTAAIYEAEGEAAALEVISLLETALRAWSRPSGYERWAPQLDSLEDRSFLLLTHWQPSLGPSEVEIDSHKEVLFPPPTGISPDVGVENRAHHTNYKEIKAQEEASAGPTPNELAPYWRLLQLSSRVSFFLRWERQLLTGTDRHPVERFPLRENDLERLQAHVHELVSYEIDISLYHAATKLIQNWLLSPGALETQQRTERLPLASLGDFKSLRSDPYRRLESLPACNELALMAPKDAFKGDPELFHEPRFDGEWGDLTSKAELLRLVTDAWTLLLLGTEVQGRLETDWLHTFVVHSHELYSRRHEYLPPKLHGLLRCPRLLRVAGGWLVREAHRSWRCATAVEAVAVWASIMRQQHRGVGDDGVRFGVLWPRWLAPPEQPRRPTLHDRLFRRLEVEVAESVASSRSALTET